MNRQNYTRTKRNSEFLTRRRPNDRKEQEYQEHQEKENRNDDRNHTGSSPKTGQERDPLEITPRQEMQRANSWAEEVEETLRNGDIIEKEEDTNQWTRDKRIPSSWAEKLNENVSEAAGKLGNGRTARMVNGQRVARKREKEHTCKNLKISKIHHWFGASSSEDTENEQDDNWNTVEREQENLK